MKADSWQDPSRTERASDGTDSCRAKGDWLDQLPKPQQAAPASSPSSLIWQVASCHGNTAASRDREDGGLKEEGQAAAKLAWGRGCGGLRVQETTSSICRTYTIFSPKNEGKIINGDDEEENCSKVETRKGICKNLKGTSCWTLKIKAWVEKKIISWRTFKFCPRRKGKKRKEQPGSLESRRERK